jgi:predicted nucleic acid-binding protein
VAADTTVFIYHLQEHPRYVDATERILESWERRSPRGVTSVIALAEVLVKPLRDGNEMAAAEYLRLLTSFPNLQLIEIDRQIAELAARLRAIHRLPLPDMIQVATAISRGATGLVTNDPALRRVKDLDVLVFDEAVRARR